MEPTDGTFYADDDRNRFLKYSAYGLFSYTDLLTDTRAPVRQQAFHFGYDTFADEAGMKSTEIASGPIRATFFGNTMAYQYLQSGRSTPPRIEHRGEIKLQANIGRSGTNKIAGEIYNMEQRLAGGSWGRSSIQTYGATSLNAIDRIILVGSSIEPRPDGTYAEDYLAWGADIGADGSYSGRVYIQQRLQAGWTNKNTYWNMGADTNSKFGGSIYGPRDEDLEDIETAGYWTLEPDASQVGGGYVVGSFGAVREMQ